ncbi:MAG: S41 family peptidase [Bdellovibrionales bacterium]
MRLSTIFTLLIVIGVGWAASLVPRRGTHAAVFKQICDLVSEKFYRNDSELDAWIKRCHENAKKVGFGWDRNRFLQEVQYGLDDFQVSHLMIYDPVEDRRLWRGEAVDTGLRARLVEGRVVVHEVIENSPAALSEVRAGDELLSVDGEAVRSAWSAQASSGKFHFRRGPQDLYIFIEPKVLRIDRAPTVRSLSGELGWLQISSFRGEYFKAEDWKKVVQEISGYKKLILDLRENSGGNLVAMLRAMSPFFCEPTTVGSLSQPRRPQEKGPAPEDNLDEMAQLALLEKFRTVPLNTFVGYGCLKMPVTVLIDGGTASVSEILAQAMLVRPQTRVWGRASAGDVLLATWYGLPLLGYGYSLSIPEALYLTLSGDSLEGAGVWPQQELNYDLKEALAGKDSWLVRAQQSF